jgi:stage II sporulation protein D
MLPHESRWRARAATLLVMVAGTSIVPHPAPWVLAPPDQGRIVRVVLAVAKQEATLGATGRWVLRDASGRVAARGDETADTRLERGDARLRALGTGVTSPAWWSGALELSVSDGTDFARWNGKRYRGMLLFVPTDTGILVVNRLGLEEYLMGVVSLEIGRRNAIEQAAVEAQAVAARSFTHIRLRAATSRDYDLVSTVSDQVYGGVDAETSVGNAGVILTSGLVLMHQGRIVNTPFHSTCGGSTAEAPELWRTNGEPWLRRVSDRVPGSSGRFYCDVSPRWSWERTYDARTLSDAVRKYLGTYAAVPGGSIAEVRGVRVDGATPSGRVAAVFVTTDRGEHRLRGNDIRFVLRNERGEILPSTYFSLESSAGRDGRVSQLRIRGTGNGHGVGMCQWGAIGRARSGQDFRTILETYYPGTTIERAP